MPTVPAAIAVYAFVVVANLNLSGFFALAPTFRDELSLSGTERDVLFAGSGLVMLLLALPLGSLSDRFGSRRLSLLAMAILCLSAVGHATAVDFWSLLAARCLFAVAFTGMLTAAMAWLSDAAGPAGRARAIGGIMPSAGAGQLAGPYLTGALADAAGTSLAFGVLAGLSLLPLALGARAPAGQPVPAERTPLSESARAFRVPIVAAAVVLTFLGIVLDTVLNILVPQQLDDNGLSASERGLVLSIGGIVFVAVALVALRNAHRLVGLRTAGLSAVVAGLVLAPLAVSDGTALQATGMIARGAALALLFVVSYPLGALGAHAAGLPIGAAAGLVMVATGLANTLAPLGGGRAADVIGAPATYAILGALAIAAGAWMLALSRSRGRLLDVPQRS